jgi:hypothetical protein
LSLKSSLSSRPVIYEIVPPRRDTSRFSTELRGIEDVLSDRRIAAINIPELINRREEQKRTSYSPATIPPEEYALMIKDFKESIVNVISPRLGKEEFERRAKKILNEYRIPNLLIVGKERHGDQMPGPSATEALRLLSKAKTDAVALGGICIFDRRASGTDGVGNVTNDMSEQKRVWLKAEAGCDFVTSQITFDQKKAVAFLQAYQLICDETNQKPVTVFISISTVPTQGILSLLETLDVVIPARVRKRLLGESNMGRESLLVAAEVFSEIIAKAKDADIKVPLGLQIEQVGVNSGELSLELLDRTYPVLKEN